jgi:hypothetical protein
MSCGGRKESLAQPELAPTWQVTRIVSWWKGGGIVELEDGTQLYNTRVMPPGTDVKSEIQATRDTRGAKRKYDWDAVYRELIRLANTPDGLPERAEVTRHIKAWFGTRDVYPSDTAIDEFVRKVFAAIVR